jgi:plastocyanin
VEISAINIAFEQKEVSAPADTAFTIRFDNKEAVPHNVEIKDASGMSMFKGDIVTGPTVVEYQVPALPAGTYQFVCTVHPNMVGTLNIGG